MFNMHVHLVLRPHLHYGFLLLRLLANKHHTHVLIYALFVFSLMPFGGLLSSTLTPYLFHGNITFDTGLLNLRPLFQEQY